MLSSTETLAEKFVNKGFWLYLFTFLIGPLGYIVKVIISRDLSVEEVGMIYGVISFIVFLSMYNDLGCTESLSYFLPKHIVNKEYGKAKYLLFIVLLAQISTSIFIYTIIFLGAPWLSEVYFKSDVTEILRIAGLFFIGINIMHIAVTIFVATQDTKLQKGAEFIRLFSTALGASILLISENGSTVNYMYIWILGLIIGVIFSIYYAIRKYYIPYLYGVKMERDDALTKHFFQYSLATLFTANIGMVLSQIDMQLIIYMLGTKDAGFYSTYLSLIGIPFMILTPIISFLFPVISELSGRNEFYKIHSLVEKFWNYFAIFGIWFSAFMFQFGEILSVLLFGEKFRESGEILEYSALFILFNLLVQIGFQVLAGTGQIKKRIKILLITLCFNIPLNLLLIPILGTKGSALAVGLSWIPLYYMTVKATGLKLPWLGNSSWLKNIVGGIFAYLISDFILSYFVYFPYHSDILLAILTYLIIFMLLNLSLLSEAYNTIKHVRMKKNKQNIQTEDGLLTP